MIQQHRDCSLFWHSIWVENGKPRNGIIAQIMRQTQAKYYYFVRWVTSNQAKLRRSRMAEDVTSGNMRNFWTECKRMTRSSTLNRCTEIDGVSEGENMAELIASKYQYIYIWFTSCKRFWITGAEIGDWKSFTNWTWYFDFMYKIRWSNWCN